MKKFFSLLLIIVIILSCILQGGCSVGKFDPTESIPVTASQDKYRNYYEIFVGSFCDSNGDNIGDLQGIISKLDYLNDGNPETDDDLGIDGIWLTPIMPSHSYHKYDVIDYYNIDEQFGTLEDFKQLVDECHKRGINVIIDMVLNHCSKFMPLFEDACKQAISGNLNDDARYFEIDYYDVAPGSTHTAIGEGYYYESNFSPYMPEWDLDADCTREYFIDIAKFWIEKYDVDGFRLDALKFYDDSNTDGEKFLKWYYNEVRKISKEVYMVGELWTGNADITDMYDSGVDSLFAFGFSGATGAFVNSVRGQRDNGLVSQIIKYQEDTKDANEYVINSFFLSNHDQIRSGNYLKVNGPSFTKMAASTYILVPGNSYIYYGEEIGMIQDSQGDGDEYKREPMVWDTENPPQIVVNDLTSYDETQAPYGGVEQQLQDENSILSHYRKLIKIKNQNPEIARGRVTQKYDFNDDNLCAYYIEYDENKLMIIHNFSSELAKEVKITDEVLKSAQMRGYVVASNGKQEDSTVQKEYVSMDGDIVKMPPQSTVVLKAG